MRCHKKNNGILLVILLDIVYAAVCVVLKREFPLLACFCGAVVLTLATIYVLISASFWSKHPNLHGTLVALDGLFAMVCFITLCGI